MTRPRSMRRLRSIHIARWLAAGAFVVGALAVGCSYSPDFQNGSLKCSEDGLCPRGYTCLSRLCCLPGDPTCGGIIPPPDASVPTDSSPHFDIPPAGTGGHPATGTGGTTGAGGAPVVSSNVATYIGTWSFTSAATLDTECEGGSSSGGPVAFLTQNNPVSTITISNNGDGTLLASWSEWADCTYTLSVDSTGAHGTDAETWACEYTYTPSTQTSSPQISDQLWNYYSFGIVTADGRTATHDGLYFRQDTYDDDSFIFCTQTLHAPMTKQ